MPNKRPYILVVDDNKITTKLMRRYLEAHDFECDEAYDGIECLEKVSKRLPDAIILDVMMPRLDGFDTIKALKSDPRSALVPVTIVTALNDIATQVRAVEVGADDFLTKPIEEKLIITKVRVLTGWAQERKANERLRTIINGLMNGNRSAVEDLLSKEGFTSQT
ncbi:MAG: response regulator [Ignavibacteria bacterium]|nr:response regulator [Ignavibacteria bacterium]